MIDSGSCERHLLGIKMMVLYTNQLCLAFLSTLLGVALEAWSDMQYMDIKRENVIGNPIEDLSHLKCFSTCKETDGCKGTAFYTKAHSDGIIGGCYLLKKAKDGRRIDSNGKQEFTSLTWGTVYTMPTRPTQPPTTAAPQTEPPATQPGADAITTNAPDAPTTQAADEVTTAAAEATTAEATVPVTTEAATIQANTDAPTTAASATNAPVPDVTIAPKKIVVTTADPGPSCPEYDSAFSGGSVLGSKAGAGTWRKCSKLCTNKCVYWKFNGRSSGCTYFKGSYKGKAFSAKQISGLKGCK